MSNVSLPLILLTTLRFPFLFLFLFLFLGTTVGRGICYFWTFWNFTFLGEKEIAYVLIKGREGGERQGRRIKGQSLKQCILMYKRYVLIYRDIGLFTKFISNSSLSS